MSESKNKDFGKSNKNYTPKDNKKYYDDKPSKNWPKK